MPEFLAPLPLTAVAVMALNDHWLKPTFHNALTGKLSDAAICFFLPLYLSAGLALVTRWPLALRTGVGATLTALLYTAINVSQRAADLFCEALAVLGGPLLGRTSLRAWADLEDLITLPLVAAAVLYSRSRASRLSSPSVPQPGATTR
jgi:hypothetical protein